jgi:hypothetical protein
MTRYSEQDVRQALTLLSHIVADPDLHDLTEETAVRGSFPTNERLKEVADKWRERLPDWTTPEGFDVPPGIVDYLRELGLVKLGDFLDLDRDGQIDEQAIDDGIRRAAAEFRLTAVKNPFFTHGVPAEVQQELLASVPAAFDELKALALQVKDLPIAPGIQIPDGIEVSIVASTLDHATAPLITAYIGPKTRPAAPKAPKVRLDLALETEDTTIKSGKLSVEGDAEIDLEPLGKVKASFRIEIDLKTGKVTTKFDVKTGSK